MLKIYLWSFFTALILGLGFTFLARSLAIRHSVYGRSKGYAVDFYLVPLWGGIGIFLAFVVSIGSLFFNAQFRLLLSSKNILVGQELAGILIGALIIVILGVIDDKKGISIVSKLLIQIIAALLIVTSGIKVIGVSLPFLPGHLFFSILIGNFLTILWLVVFTNIINLIDDTDGLAGGIVVINSLVFLVVAILLMKVTRSMIITRQLQLTAILCTALGGASLGFLFYNFHPAKIVLGNSGKMFVGFMLGVITVVGRLKTTAVIALFIPLVFVGMPFLNLFFSVLQSSKKKELILKINKKDFQYRLLKKGWTQREIMFMMYFVVVLAGIFSILVVIFENVIVR
ncbi:undecaprenyl/decaprenyl-phosphate alpha-N-acetylglucosaminyl 1-phosphate transferase [bacterium]|nr:undecaprenyl/decaprenyl-phosphate alpha-N-acetylglucosaminyl 1-phosphate transferase [bacterium]